MKVSFRPAAALATGCLLTAFAAFLAFPQRALGYISEGVSLWAVSVLPAALPFLFFTGMLAETPLFARAARLLAPLWKPFGISGAGGCAALLSLLSGYPAGAKAVQQMAARGQIEREECLRCACLASTSGPAFLVGVAGTAMAGDPAVGWLLFAAHVFGIFVISLLLGASARRQETHIAIDTRPLAQAFPETLASSVLSVLTVGGAVALFYAFGKLLSDALAPLALPAALTATLAGLMELTSGCAALLASPSLLTLPIAAFLITFGGVCVLAQQWSFLAKTGISLGKFLLVKLAQATLAALACLALVLLTQ